MHIAARTSHLKESVIRGMTRVALGCGAINLSQGFPDYDPPAEGSGPSKELASIG